MNSIVLEASGTKISTSKSMDFYSDPIEWKAPKDPKRLRRLIKFFNMLYLRQIENLASTWLYSYDVCRFRRPKKCQQSRAGAQLWSWSESAVEMANSPEVQLLQVLECQSSSGLSNMSGRF